MRKEEILANCIDEIQAGKFTLEECLTRYPEVADELRALLKIAINIQPKKAVPTTNFRQQARLRLLEEMEASTARAIQGKAGMFGWLKPLVLRPIPLITAIIILVLVVGGGTTVYASQGSLPDDTLYPVKIGVESLQLTLTRSPEAKASLHLRLAQRRLDEVIAQSSLGRDISTSALEAIATQLNAAIIELDRVLPDETKALLSQLSGLTLEEQGKLGQLLAAAPESKQQALEQAIDAGRRGNLIARVGYGNPAILGSAPSVLDEKIESAYFELKGTLLSVDNSTWNIGGLLIRNVNSVVGIPPIGSRVEIEGVVQGSQTFISEVEYEEAKKEGVKIKGIFGGTSPDGAVWYIGGIAVNMPPSTIPPPEGIQIELEGITANGVFTIIKMETEDDEEIEERKKEKVEVDGVLVGIDRGKKTILVEVARARVTIDISSAQIEGEDEQPLSMSDLESLIGEEIEVVGSYREDGLFRAIKVFVDVELEEENEKLEEYEAEEDHKDDEEEEEDD